MMLMMMTMFSLDEEVPDIRVKELASNESKSLLSGEKELSTSELDSLDRPDESKSELRWACLSIHPKYLVGVIC